MKLQHKFVEFMPEEIEQGFIYISVKYCTAIHKCVCGCNNEVVTPISPKGWHLIFDGETISLTPSIGNWNLDCKSHYFITHNDIRFARKWGQNEIEKARMKDKIIREKYYNKKGESNR